jgi:DNA polymerase-3 subunit beta
LLQYSDEDALTIEAVGDSAAQIAMQNGNVILRSVNAADFPLLRPETPQAAGYLPCARLAEAFEKTVFAVERNSMQYTLCGVCLQFSESKLAAIATDGRRAAMVQRNINWYGEPLKGSVIVPEKAVNIIARILSDREGNVEIGLRDNTIHFAQDNVEVWALLVEGRFPKCDQLFEPVDGETTTRIPREPFIAAVKKAACISEDIMQVSLVIRDNVIEVSSATSCGSVDLEVDVSGNGNDATILFDPAFLIEYLAKSRADEVLMSFHGETEPVRFTDGDSKCVIMPMVPVSDG